MLIHTVIGCIHRSVHHHNILLYMYLMALAGLALCTPLAEPVVRMSPLPVYDLGCHDEMQYS